MTRSTWPRWLHWVVWLGVAALLTAALLPFRDALDKAHYALAYVLLVLAASVAAGNRVGLALAGLAFLLFDWFFLPPYNRLNVGNPLDWFVLVTFLVVSVVGAQLLHRLQNEAAIARERAEEIDRLATLGAETLNVARAADALAAIAEVIRRLGATACRIFADPMQDPAFEPDSLIRWVAQHGLAAVRDVDGTIHRGERGAPPRAPTGSAREILIPLQVRQQTVGVLQLTGDHLGFSAAQHRFLDALSFYAALAVERARLETISGHADALRESDRLKNALLASVSHDLRTPLTTIKGVAHELTHLDQRVSIIESEADRLNRMVGDLLDLSQVQAGIHLATPEITPVDDLIGAVLQRVSGAMPSREIQVEMEDGGTLLVGRFDLTASLRVLVNLIDNAHKYSPLDRPILLTAMRSGQWLELAVSDSGPGVPPSEQERIFEPFYRPEGAPPDLGSAGLGLAIARGLAEAQGGSLRYLPRGGGGSRFILLLPAAELPGQDLAS